MVDLVTLLPPNSGWTLTQANGISSSGQIIGVGVHNGISRGFLMTPTTGPQNGGQSGPPALDPGSAQVLCTKAPAPALMEAPDSGAGRDSTPGAPPQSPDSSGSQPAPAGSADAAQALSAARADFSSTSVSQPGDGGCWETDGFDRPLG
jgi:hypothetical protein